MKLGNYVATEKDIQRAISWLEEHEHCETESIVSQVRDFVESSYEGEKLFFCPIPG